MASFFGSCYMLVSLIFVFMLIGPSFAEKYINLKKICSKTTDQHRCMKLMKSDSRTADADIRGLTDVGIDLAYSKANDIQRDLNSHYDNRIDYNILYSSCSKNYEDAIRDLKQTRKLFYDGDYKRIAVQVTEAKEEVRVCKNSASSSSDIITWNKEFELLCDVVKFSSKLMTGDSYSLFIDESKT